MVVCPTCGWDNETGTYCERCRTNLVTGEPPEPPAAPQSPAGDGGSKVVLDMSADRSHYERMVDDDQRDQVPFPEDFETRQIELSDERATLGRVSPGKPVDVDIAIEGDPGISHYQCIFTWESDGWVVQDGKTDGSTNGVYINDRKVRLTPSEAHHLADGDRIYIGAWTCLTASFLPPEG